MSQSEPRKLLAELARLESLRSAGDDPGKRQFGRFVVRADAELSPMNRTGAQQPIVPILLRDLGKGGIGFVVEEPLDVNSSWHISFLKDGYIIGSEGMIVRHSKHIKNNTYLVGGQFCATSGLLSLMGVKPSDLCELCHPGEAKTENDTDNQKDFLAPDDL